MSAFNKTEFLFESDPFEFSKENKELFVDSFREMSLYHYENQEYIKFLWDKNKIHPTEIKSEEDLKKIPYMLVNLFKYHEFITGDPENIELTLGSSGTGGQRSLMHLDSGSLRRVKTLAYNVHESLGMTSKEKYNYLCFTYDPHVAKDLGTAFTDELLTSFTGKNEVFYTFQHDGNEFFFDEEGTVETLKSFANSEYSTRILGFPAFLYQILENHDFNLDLGSDSWLQTGGGWKGQADKEIPKEDFRDLVNKRLGIPKANIRDLFGMVEHGIPYVDCSAGKLRVPNYARVFIRDPKTLEVLNYGEKGLIQFLCSYNSSYPSFSLLTTDWGTLEKDEMNGDILTILGRAGLSKNKGCAIKAAEMLK